MTSAALAPAVTESALWLIPGLPLLGAALLLMSGRRGDRRGHLLGCAAALASFCVAAWQFAAMAGRDAPDRAAGQTLFTWVSVGDLHVDLGLRLDQLSMVFVLLVTGVGLLIHVYSIGYMAADPARRKFFAYLNLFLAAMLLLVLADNFLVLYLGWEGVGLVSYLLIGFWQHKPSAATAAKKAFLVNRVGDIGLAVAMLVMVTQLGTLDFDGVFAAVEGGVAGGVEGIASGAGGAAASSGLVTALGLLLLLGACAKSAQVPLQSWLGDAMEGPTPVSALIHAATMVTAGVYLITRANPIFDAAPAARTAVIVVGAVTLLFGAVIGCAKDDIKKVLAASTMSQVGYMVMAAGFGPAGYALAIMHLLTHGFFKAGLFLGAGSVMHGMDDQVDMRRYGALRAVMPVTFVTFGLGYLAIIGVPPFSGFYSKEGIISAAFDVGAGAAGSGAGSAGGYLLGSVALLGAGLTAFYMTRVMILTFFGERRWNPEAHPHESPVSMTAPMVVVAVGSALSGALLAIGGRLEDWLAPVVGEHHAEHVVPVWLVTTASLVVVAAGIAVAVRLYFRADIPATAPAEVTALTRAARRDLYADAVNERALMRPGQGLVAGTAVVDRRVVTGAASGVAGAIGLLSAQTRLLQSGLTRSYALYMLIGAALIIAAMVGGGPL